MLDWNNKELYKSDLGTIMYCVNVYDILTNTNKLYYYNQLKISFADMHIKLIESSTKNATKAYDLIYIISQDYRLIPEEAEVIRFFKGKAQLMPLEYLYCLPLIPLRT